MYITAKDNFSLSYSDDVATTFFKRKRFYRLYRTHYVYGDTVQYICNEPKMLIGLLLSVWGYDMNASNSLWYKTITVVCRSKRFFAFVLRLNNYKTCYELGTQS